jgi:GntR family transcriptional regulator
MRNVLYLEIVDDIKNKIRNGDLKPGDLILPEYELAEKYGVSRTTLRKSLALLLNEGYIYSIPGKGNYVCKPSGKAYHLDFEEIDSLKVQIDDIQLVDVKAIPATKKLIEKLQVGPYDKIIRVRKVFKAKGKGVEYALIYVPYEKGNPIVEDIINFANFYKVMEKQSLHFQIRKKLEIHVVNTENQVMEYLSVRAGEPLFLITQQILAAENDAPISYSEFYIRGDVLILQAEAAL